MKKVLVPFNYLLVKSDKAKKLEDKKTTAGLYIPNTAQNEPSPTAPVFGTVIAAGQRLDGRPNFFKKDDRVCYSPYTAIPIEFEGEDFVFLSEDSVMGTEVVILGVVLDYQTQPPTFSTTGE